MEDIGESQESDSYGS
jgi:hypothetical protein